MSESGARGGADDRFVVLSFLDELAATPDLLADYALLFAGRTDVTLVVLAPGFDSGELELALAPLVSALGLDREGSADVLIVVETGAEQLLAPSAGAVYTRIARNGCLSELPQLGDAGKLARLTLGQPLASLTIGKAADDLIRFTCNVCGAENAVLSLRREGASCACDASMRFRSVVRALSLALFEADLPLWEFPQRPDLHGIGMTDWGGYAEPLAAAMDYANTFLHQEPRFDITDPDPWFAGALDFVISTEVFEHVAPPIVEHFATTRRLLKPGGVLLLTVPWRRDGETLEHFPSLYDYDIVEHDGRRVLLNTTADGRHERFEKLNFHGGEGETLELRQFALPSLVENLRAAGFGAIDVLERPASPYGIDWSEERDDSWPILAWAPDPLPLAIRGEAVVVDASELRERPQLLDAFRQELSVRNVALVVYAPDGDEAEICRWLAPLCEDVEVLLLAVPGSATVERRLADAAVAVLGDARPAFGRLRRLDRAHLETPASLDGNARDDAALTDLIERTLGPNDAGVDIGCHRAGVLAEMLRVAPHGAHVAYEPLQHLVDEVRGVHPRADVRCAAVSDRAGETEFTHVVDWPGYSGFRPHPHAAGERQETIRVRTVRLDDDLPAGLAPKLIKIDVEGAELQVLEGALETIRRHRPTIVFEHGSAAVQYGTTPGRVYDLLVGDIGLHIYDFAGNGPYEREAFVAEFGAGRYWNFAAVPEGNPTPSNRVPREPASTATRCVIVAGMHRSGTSAVAKTIDLLGVPVEPEDKLVEPAADNPTGFWESKTLLDLNERLLARLGGNWCGVPLANEDWSSPALSDLEGDARAAARAAGGDGSWTWKDPRICLTLPFWRRVLDTEPVVVLPYRNPLAIWRSLERRNGIEKMVALAVWERYARRTLEACVGLPVYVLDYDGLLADPHAGAAELAAFLGRQGLPAALRQDGSLDAFLDPSLNHAAYADADFEADPDVTQPQRELFRLLRLLRGAHEPFPAEVLEALGRETSTTDTILSLRRQVDWLASS